MHYPPSHRKRNFENIVALIQTYPLATIVSAKNGAILSSPPLVYQKNKGWES